MAALKSLDKYVRSGQVKLNLKYFADEVSPTPPKYPWGTNCPAVVTDIIASHPDNVIIMTDADGDSQGTFTETAVVRGTVWWLWREGKKSRRFKDHVIGKKSNKEFTF